MVMMSLLFALAVVASPAEKFVQLHPGSAAVRSADGQQLVHASGFSVETGARTPEDAARAFLGTHGNGFGISARQKLVVRNAPAPEQAGAVRFARTIDGLSVFGGDIVVGIDGSNRAFLVNTGAVAPTIQGRHLLDEPSARQAALSAFAGGVRGAGPAKVEAGWQSFGTSVRAVYQVDFFAADPAGDWRIVVDGETGTPLFRVDLRNFASAPGKAFEVSPVETAAGLCPVSASGARTLCATAAAVTFANLATGSSLIGTQTSVYNCDGLNYPSSAADVPGACVPVNAAAGTFEFPVDGTFQSKSDNFAAAMAYYHLDKHVTFLKALDSTIPGSGGSGGSSRALRGSLPALVNALEANAPYENASFRPLLDAMVFGQGAQADFAYDATVMYHELTHGVVWAWGGFDPTFDSAGTNWESKALNEGTADAMAASETGRSLFGGFLGAMNQPPMLSLRDLDDASASRTCHGDGTTSAIGGVNGLYGEEHDDGEIWNGFFWEVFDGLRAAGVKGCGGSCEAASAIQYKALQLAAGTAPTFNTYWQTFKSAAAALFPDDPDVAGYVDCVAKRRKLDQCDRTFPLYAGESKLQFVAARFSPFQITLPTTGAATLRVCSLGGSSATLYGRVGQSVQIAGPDALGNATFVADGSVPVGTACSSAGTFDTVTLNGGGTWYLLVDLGPSGQPANFVFNVLTTNVAARPAATPPSTCLAAPLSIKTAPPQLPPRGHLTFAASGGSSTARTWSLTTNASGATIDAHSGVYMAGAAGNATDVVKVTDSAGNSVTENVAVTAGVSISPATASAVPGATISFSANGGSGTGFVWSLTTHASGGAINASTGVYTAGPTGSVTDVVQVTDSLGNLASASIPIASAPKAGGGCNTTGLADAPLLGLALAALLRSRRMGRGSRSSPRSP
jgi:Zn-dependent metalloprotease